MKLRFVFEKQYTVNHEKTCKVLSYLKPSDRYWPVGHGSFRSYSLPVDSVQNILF